MTTNPGSAKAHISRRAQSSWKWIILALLGYAFLFDNSNSLPVAAGYDWTHLMQLPRQIRFIELFIVAGCVLLLISKPKSSRISCLLFLGCMCFGFIATLSYLHNIIVPLVDFGRLTYSYVLPILIFIIGREAAIAPSDREQIFKLILIWVLISAILSWVQFIILGYPVGDDITGLNKDAHANGNLLAFIALISASFWITFRQVRQLLLSFFAVCTLILSSVLKTNIFLLFAFGMMSIISINRDKTSRSADLIKKLALNWVLICVLLVGGYFIFMNIDLLNTEKVGEAVISLLENPSDFGPIAAQFNAISIVADNPTTILLGMGPFSYGNSISMGQTLEGGSLQELVLSALMLSQGESGESVGITLTTSLLVELGLFAFIILTITYAAVVGSVWRCVHSKDRLNRAYAVGLLGCLLILLLTAAVALFGGFDTMSVSWPVMLLAGITCRIEAENKVGHIIT